jgi:UDP-N-acetylglucosamine 2-epimerase (non-hydrolysing)
MKDILIISGTRPEIIKLAPLYHALQGASWSGTRWLHTGQHDEMARQNFACFDIQPDMSLERAGTSLSEFAIGCRQQLDAILDPARWSAVVVQGDTESAFQGALTAFYHQIPGAHVEAGLRTHNLQGPFPEEGLRQMISRVTRFHFAPTARARAALVAEGIPAESIWMTGNTVVDAQLWACAHKGVRRRVEGRGHLLVTVHRRENWGGGIEEICGAIKDIAERHPDLDVLFPVHLNPVVSGPVRSILSPLANVRLTPPLDYLAMQQAVADAWLVLTDSGGLQEEAPTFRIPLLVLREETEREEAIRSGCAALAGTSRHAIVERVDALWHDAVAYHRMQQSGNPFGDGSATQRIVTALERHLATPSVTAAAAA